MAGPRQPVDLLIANGKKHLTKEEIKKRRAEEPPVFADDMEPPTYLTAAQKKHFKKLAGQLEKIGIIGETDTETLARYVIAEHHYEKAVKDLRALKPPKKTGDPETDGKLLEMHIRNEAELSKVQDRFFKQAHTAATALGLTIAGRVKLVVPVAEEPVRVNKFSKFGVGGLQ